MVERETICALLDKAVALSKNEEVVHILFQIRERAEKMEARLLLYCNAIEDLGFTRDGRDYAKQ